LVQVNKLPQATATYAWPYATGWGIIVKSQRFDSEP
jgi:hypothetical protein